MTCKNRRKFRAVFILARGRLTAVANKVPISWCHWTHRFTACDFTAAVTSTVTTFPRNDPYCTCGSFAGGGGGWLF